MKTSEVLYGAADHITAFGHARDTAYDTSGGGSHMTAPSCIIGATYLVATNEHSTADLAIEAVDTYLEPAQLLVFNSTHSAEEVIETLRACAVIEQAKEEALVPEKVSA